ncbi:hypothetical protein Lgee_0277 [Legionella geestiana]|uniref:Uncharacterized protein n=1 Tax=Legionella geestiana TaxID=45065 RepID=A0A0W0U9D6_9GAMM|nr:hypothetical protein [Legionella geestiana]KTD04247.1 hypothetical protein Lgee_0277 [Legionella geestiana]QBS11666.1 hypothetical protein E4T54_02315 [Legionella geestiana]STX53648.1 Uncharacterised protein [Legionella geestiana]
MPHVRVNGSRGKAGECQQALHGEHGGEIRITLSQPHDSIIVSGSHSLSFAAHESLALSARGGDGAPGIIGADGFRGQPGYDGLDASEYSPGTNGGPGGDGGPGAPGGHGGNAGNGGRIEVSVNAADLALLATIDTVNVSAGLPGRAGRHGAGGPGGAGGRGGASYSWQEAYTDYETHYDVVTHHGHHHHGHGSHHSHHSHLEPHTVAVTRFRTRKMPGGKDGVRGRQGASPATPLYPGKPGTSGTLVWNVYQHDGTFTSYPTRYSMQLTFAEISGVEAKGVLEPFESISASCLLTNTSADMPTPMEEVPVLIQPQKGLTVKQCAMFWGNLSPLATVGSVYPAQFEVEGPAFHAGESPWLTTLTLCAKAHNKRLDKAYPNVETRQQITVRFPVELRPKPAHYAIAAGEVLTLEAEVYNLATKALGFGNGRSVAVEFTIPGGATIDAPCMDYLETIQPQSSCLVKRRFSFIGETVEGETKTFESRLFLQSIDRSVGLALIQQKTFIVQFTPRFSPPVDGGFLLVMNAQTSPAIFAAWRSLLRQLAGNEGVAVWNSTYYNGFSPDRVPEGYDCDLLAMASMRTLVILDNPWQANPLEALHRDSSSITATLLERANRETRTSVVAVSNTGLPAPEGELPDWIPGTNILLHGGIDTLIQTLFMDAHSQRNNYTLTMPRSVHGCWPFASRPTVTQELESLNLLLRALFPHRRYQVRHSSSTTNQLTLIVHRQKDPFASNHLHQIAPILEEGGDNAAVRHQMLSWMPFEQKLQLFTKTTPENMRAFARALTEDLLEEQRLAGQAQAYGSLLQRLGRVFARDFSLELERLQMLVRTLQELESQGLMTEASAWRPHVVALIAAVQFEVEQHTGFWLRLLHWFLPQTTEQLRECTLHLCQQAQAALGGQVQEALGQEMERLDFARRLERFIADNNAFNPGLFRRALPALSLNAAREMLVVCRGEAERLSGDNAAYFHQDAALVPWFREFQALFPDNCSAEFNERPY